MKLAIFGVLALCLVLTNGAVVDDIELRIRTLDNLAKSLTDKAENQILQQIEHKFDEIFVEHLVHVDKAFVAFEARQTKDAACVSQQQANYESVVVNLESSIETCSYTANTRGAALAWEIIEVSIELAYDTYSIVIGVKNCKTYESTFWEIVCYAQQAYKVERLIVKTIDAAKALNGSSDETVEDILSNLESCSIAAKVSALSKLDTINSDINRCVAQKL